MHHHMVVKIWAENAEDAVNEVSCITDESLEAGSNECGWDSSEVTHITRDMLQSDYGVSSFAKLEKKMLQERTESIINLAAEIKNDLLPVLAPLLLTKDEAPLYITTENTELMEYLEKFTKRKRDIKRPPTSFEGLHNLISDVVINIAKQDTGRSMIMYRMEQLKKLQYCVVHPLDTTYTFQSHENPYAEIGIDSQLTLGLSPYYVLVDRHF